MFTRNSNFNSLQVLTLVYTIYESMRNGKETEKIETLPGIPFHYNFYMVYWEDIQSDSGWRTLKEIQNLKPAICVSTG